MTDLPDLLAPDRLKCGCEIRSKKRTLQTIAELLGASLRDAAAPDADPEAEAESTSERNRGDGAENERVPISDMGILDALITRERLGSTGIGHGIALPHSRLAGIHEPIAAMVTLSDGVDYDAIDDVAVDVIVGLLVPEQCNDEHLQILATLARRFSDADHRAAIRRCSDAEELMSILDGPQSSDPLKSE